jgi:RHS repeat-associated protein
MRFDFKGNLLESKKKFTTEYKNTIDWSTNPALENEEFVSETQYDALNRATNIFTPNNGNVRSEIIPAYDEGGLLKGVKAKLRGAVQETDFVTGIAYNPKGQRERIRYGNGATTKYTYDDKNFRLTRLLTTRENGTENLQDLNYVYDQMGNITQITDNAQQTIFFSGTAVNPSQTFEYDALYRLVKATGREHNSIGADSEPETEGYNPAQISPEDGSAMRNYVREWEYDKVGNILNLIHQANSNSWTRSYSYAADSNRLNSTEISNSIVSYTYNQHGSMASMPHLQNMDWDFAERLSHITKGSGSGAIDAYYNYDGSGQRTRKVVEKGNTIEERLYLGGFEIFRKHINGTIDTERETLHIMDDTKRIALVETLTADNGVQIANPTLVQRYQLSNNIESATLELDESAQIISYEEYYPYGDTSYQAGKSIGEVSQKRYRYTGKEKDEESGLYYMLARYYSGWLGRWTASDPAGLVDGPNLYAYCRGNPVILMDRDGTEATLPLNAKSDIYRELGPKHYNAIHFKLKESEKLQKGNDKEIGSLIIATWVENESELNILSKSSRKTEYSVVKEGINVNIASEVYGVRDLIKPYQGLFHESAHMIDALASIKNDKDDLPIPYSYSYKDNLFGRTIKKEITQRIEEKAFDIFKKELLGIKPSESRALIVDIVEGATGKKIANDFERPKDYWKEDYKLSAEAFAHMFSAAASNTEALAVMKKYLPESYEVFKDILREMPQGEK